MVDHCEGHAHCSHLVIVVHDHDALRILRRLDTNSWLDKNIIRFRVLRIAQADEAAKHSRSSFSDVCVRTDSVVSKPAVVMQFSVKLPSGACPSYLLRSSKLGYPLEPRSSFSHRRDRTRGKIRLGRGSVRGISRLSWGWSRDRSRGVLTKFPPC
jgi:hypothetical protein